MPSSSKELRDFFMVNGSDGIAEAEKMITDRGGTVEHGLIRFKGEPPADVVNAINFLVHERDYGFEKA